MPLSRWSKLECTNGLESASRLHGVSFGDFRILYDLRYNIRGCRTLCSVCRATLPRTASIRQYLCVSFKYLASRGMIFRTSTFL